MELIEVIRKLEQGKTEPYLCRAENDIQYVVKGRSALVKGCINEVLGATLGQVFGLPVPNFKILTLPEAILECDSDLQYALGEGSLFGSEYLAHAEELNRSILEKLAPQMLRDIFIFDYWIKNEDRCFTAEHGGNPNLFYRQADSFLIVADHNLAFDVDFKINDFKRLHVGAKAWFDAEIAETSIVYY